MSDARRAVHEAAAHYLDEGEIAVHWCMVIEVAGPDGQRYLAPADPTGEKAVDALLRRLAAKTFTPLHVRRERPRATARDDPRTGQG